jgi:hypothetical protein
MQKLAYIFRELREHLPFTTISALLGIVFVSLLTLATEKAFLPIISEQLFHIFHPIHVLLSATATTTIFWHSERNLLKAIPVGLAGSLFVCGLSDAFIPYLGSTFLGIEMEFHLCLLREPTLIIPFAFFGVLLGIIATKMTEKSTFFSHSSHITVSAFASMLYLTSFGFSNWLLFLFPVFIILIIGVMVPCCISDIVFPLCVAKK